MTWSAGLASLLACAHEEPFHAGSYAPDGPYNRSLATRLTFDPGADSTPVWLPDEREVLYSYERRDRGDADRCLGILPAGGGSRRAEICHNTGLGLDSTDHFVSPALSPGGRLAYFRTTRPKFRNALTFVGIGVGTLDAPETGPLLDNLPGTVAGGIALTAARVQWLSDSALVYLAVALPAPFVPTLGLAVVRGRIVADSAVWDILPGTDSATSMAVAGPDELYYTLLDDSRVFHRVLSIDSTTVTHDFGPGRFPTSVQAALPRLAVIIRNPGSGLNEIWLVDLRDGSELRVSAPGAALGQALAPSGTRLAAVLTTGGNVDVWMLDLP